MLNKINHIVVLMMENRSFDHMAGWLYDPLNDPPFNHVPRGQAFDGLSGKSLSNPIPQGVNGAWRKKVPVGRTTNPENLQVSPAENYTDVNLQLFGTNTPPKLPVRAPMNGFVKDFIRVLKQNKKPLTYSEYKTVMDCYTPHSLPVLSTLAYEYAICDHWFSSVPAETWANRSFLNAATSSGLLDNAPYRKWLTGNDAETIFNRISDSNDPSLTWRVYFDKLNLVPLTLLIHFPVLAKFWSSHFSHMEQFMKDAKQGTLPSYSLIEPRYNVFPNDQHPPHSILPGEKLIYDVYQALRNGKHWKQTLLIITYDEHGGCYDHVSPPAAVPPHRHMKGQYGFLFNRLGVRVPTILVSPYIERGTVFRTRKGNTEVALDHTSIIKTITNRWGLNSLTDRDKAAMDVSQVLTRSRPRRDSPKIVLQDTVERIVDINQPLNALQRKLIRGIASFLSITPPKLKNVSEALSYIEKLAESKNK